MLEATRWYARSVLNLCFTSAQALVHGMFHPRRVMHELLAPVANVIGQYHSSAKRLLLDFRDTELAREISEGQVFAMSDVFALNHRVMQPSELQVLSALVRTIRPARIFEFGTCLGFSTLHLALNSPDECLVYTLDLPPGLDRTPHDERIYGGRRECAKIRELLGDSLEFDFTPYFGQMDLVFVDGNHAAPFIRSDTKNALKMLSPEGVVVWHDYDPVFHRAVFDHLNELAGSRKIYSVPKTRLALHGPGRIR
jgi:predicted O-methyltransferase YrrM